MRDVVAWWLVPIASEPEPLGQLRQLKTTGDQKNGWRLGKKIVEEPHVNIEVYQPLVCLGVG